MKIMMKRSISLLLTLVMVLAMVPAINVHAATLEGYLDAISCPEPGKLRVAGWGRKADNNLYESVEIHVYVGGVGYNLGIASNYRADPALQGNYGFDTTFEVEQYGTQEVTVYLVSLGMVSVPLATNSIYISPPDPAYGDPQWNLSQHDDCPGIPDGVYRIAAAANPNFSLDITAGLLDDATNLQLYSNGESDAQLFHLRRISYGDMATGLGINETRTIVSFMNIKSQRFLDKDSNSNNVHQFGSLADNAYRQWIMHNNGDGTYSFESVAVPGYYMTIEGGAIGDGKNIGVAAPGSDGKPTLYQKFYLNAEYVHGDNRLGGLDGFLKTGEYRIWTSSANSRNDTRVLDIPNASKDQGTQAQIWTVGTAYSLHQIFDIRKAEEGWYTIRNISSGLYLAAASGAAGKHADAVQQLHTNSDAAKWAFVPRVRSDGSLSYWIVNKATGLYLIHLGNADGDDVAVCYVDNSSVVDNDWRSWGMEACLSAASAEDGAVTNGATGIAPDQFDITDTISLPIKIYDYNDDGLLFEYSLSTEHHDNGGFSLVAGSVTANYPSWTIGRTTFGKDNFGDQINPNLNNYFVGSGQFWNSSPDGLNNMYMVTGSETDLEYLAQLLGYSFYGEMISGNCTMGLVKPTLREVDGNRLMEYNDEVVAYVADLLDWTLTYREQYDNGDISLENSTQDIPIGTPIEGYKKDMAGLLLEQLKGNGESLHHYSADSAARRQQIYDTLVETYSKQDKLIGTWEECKEYITTYTDAAYFLLNNLFYPASYNMPQDKFDYLVLSKATLSNGKNAYVFDSDFSDSYNYVAGTTKSAVKYDFTAKTISNTSMLGKPFERAILDTAGGAHYTFLPVWEDEGVQNGFINHYSGNYSDKNYNYVLQCNGKFTYNESDGLFFDFEGDDDVYLFINGQLVLDIGGAHGATAINMNLNDYVYAARAKVAAGSTDPRDLALALVDGEDYSFDFYYMERRTAGANMRIATNIRVSDPNLDTDKKAYQNGQELNNGGLVNADEHVEYSFKLSNPEDSISNLYHLTFADAKLGVTIDSTNGLTVNGSKTLNSKGEPLTAADLKIYFTNQKGDTHEVTLDGSTDALKTYLEEINGNGLLPGCSIEIRGIYYNIEDSDFVSGRFTNTLHVTANQKADGTGNTYQDSVNMVVCIASGPQYYQWAGHSLSVTTDKFTSDVNDLLTEGSALLEQIAPATSLGTVTNLELCDLKGNVIHSSHVTASSSGISINYSKPGTYVFYVKVTQNDNSTVIIPVQAYVVGVEDSVFVLDYGLKVNLADVLTAMDTLSVAGKTTGYTIEAMTSTAPSYENNHITFSNGAQSVHGAYGNFVFADGGLEYHPDAFMKEPDSIYVAFRVYEGDPSKTIGTVNINTEVEMYKKITVLPANVVYYEDDFPTITYYGNDDGNTANTFNVDGSSGSISQSADQSVQYGYDDAYDSGTTNSGSSAHVIKILDANVAAQFQFTGTGFELIGRSMEADNCVIYLDVLDSGNKLVKRIPVIMEYDNQFMSNEGIYQVPIVRVDDLDHGTYTVQIHGVPVYKKASTSAVVGGTKNLSTMGIDRLEHNAYAMQLRGITAYTTNSTGGYVVDTDNPPTLYIDGLRIYNPLSTSDSNRDHYIDGEDSASFLEIRDLVLEGKAAVVKYDANSYSVTNGTSTFTENRNGKLYPVNTFTINSVSNVGYFADVSIDAQTGNSLMGLRAESSKLGNHQFEFTLAKTENDVNYYYIHINTDGTERYMKKADNSVTFVSLDPASEDSFLWVVSYLDVDAGLVTIRDNNGSYLSVSSVDAAQKTGQIVLLSTDTITDAQKWELGAVPSTAVFEGNEVTSVNDYLVFGPNNELYLDGVTNNQALVFYFTPDSDSATTTMLQVGVHVLNDSRLFGGDGELTKPGKLWQGANTGTPGWKVMDDDIRTSTERYYSIDLSACKYEETNNRYEVVLYCEDGYLSFTNLKVSGGTISAVNGEIADLRYNNGVLELLNTQTNTWTVVANSQNYVNFASISQQMSATAIYEPDVDTGELVPVLPDEEENEEDAVKLVSRSLLFDDIIRMRFYFDISATGITTTTPENSGLLVWTKEEYAALDSYTVDTAGQQIRGLTASGDRYYADTHGIPAKNMVDQLYVCAYVILSDGTYVYSDVSVYSPVTYAQRILAKESSSASMKELVVALMNYGAAAQVYFNYKTDNLMNNWLTDEQKDYAWSEDMINALPTDTSKYTFAVNDQIVWRAASVSFTGAVKQNYYFTIPQELLQNAVNVELLYWTESDYNALSELTVENARKVAFNTANCGAVIEGTAAKALGDASYFAVHIVYEDGEAFSKICVYSAHHYARRLLSKDTTSDAMKELAKALVYYSCKAKTKFGG